jgi:hypothetical protein
MQTIEQMKIMGHATEKEAKQAILVWKFLEPCLKIQSDGRVLTAGGTKTALGLLRSIVNVMDVE